jgi:hypothetical protein
MKLIAKRDFRNTGQAIEIEDAIHPDHVHKGAIFIVGKEEKTPFDGLSRQDKEFVSLLNAADCIADGSDDKIVKQVMAEVAADKKAEAARAALDNRAREMVAAVASKK